MKAHTSQFKEDIKTIGKQLDSKITYELDGVVQTLTSEQLNSITPTFQGAILKSVMKELDIDSNIDIPIGTEVNYQFGLKTEGDFEYVNYGNYIVYSSEKQEDYDSYKIVCYDKMLYSMKKNEDLGITYPKTIRDYMNALCNKLGLEFKNKDDEFANFDRQIGEELYAGQDYTYRDIFDQLAEVTASTICLDENDKVEIRYINDLTDLYTVNGKEVTFESNIEYPMSFQVNGNTEQTTYSGKNKFNYITTLVSSNYGLTNKINADGSITTTGKPTRDYASVVSGYAITDALEDGETYTLSQAIASNKVYAQINARKKSDNTYTYIPLNNNTIKSRSFKVDKTTYASYTIDVQTSTMAVWGDESLTINNKYMLCKGTDTADTSFEPYVGGQPSPNPDYPQEIENVRGVENLLNIPDGTYTDNGVTAVAKDGVVTINGTATANSFISIPFNYTFLANTNYTLSVNNTLTMSGENYIRFNYRAAVYVPTKLSSVNAKHTSNFNENTTVNVFTIRTESGKTYNNFVIKPMLEKRIISHDYMPYGSNYLQLKKRGKNFLIYPYIFKSTNTHNGITYVPNDDGSVTINGTATSDSWFILSNNTQNWYLDDFETYEFTILDKNEASVNGITPQYWSAKTGHHRGQNGVLTLNYSEDNTTGWNFVILVYKGTTVSNVTVYPMIRKASVQDTSFEPYKSESTLIDLKGNELCSNKDKTVKDNLFVTNKGKVEIFKKIGEYVFTGNETFSFVDNGTRIKTDSEFVPQLSNVYIPQPSHSDNITPSFCTHYILSSQNNIVKGSNKFAFSQWSTIKYIYFPPDYDTIEEFKAKLKSLYDAGTPVKVQFQLENPEAIELDPVTSLKSYIGQNNISNNADADMNVTYSKNYETIDANFLKDINVNFGEKYGPVNSIVLSRSAESDNIYLQDEESITKNGLCEIKIKDNQIMNWNDRSDYLPDILEKLDGLEYYLNDFVSTGIAYLDLCDKYNVNVFENNYPCIMFNDELLVTQGLEENVHTNMPEETQTDYTKSDKTDRRINQAYIIVDKQQQEITSLTKQTNSIQDNLTNNYYTIEQSNTLIQNAQSGLTNTFSEAGGNNIFRNTGLWFSQSDANNPYEYWTGKNVSKQNTDKSSNGSLMMLKKGTLEQEQVVSNGNYTVSFKYKKLIQLATCKVIVNDNEYELTQMTDTEWQTGSKDADGNIVIKPLEVTSNHINVKFTSTVDNAVEIYDLMVNAGTVKLAYSQNENEVTTDTVNISKGITITSSANDTKFKANADGIRIVDKNNEKTILTKFTDKGMSTKELEVENSATIVKVLVQNVGSQTWFTRI